MIVLRLPVPVPWLQRLACMALTPHAARTTQVAAFLRRTTGVLARTVRLMVALSLVTLISSACRPQVRDPEFVGVVVDREFLPDGVRRFTIEGGQHVDLDLDRANSLDGGSGGPVGTLLLAGETVGDAWHILLAERGEGCFRLDIYATDADDSIIFDNGLRLPKADGFDPGSVSDGRYDQHPQSGFCVNRNGEVESYSG
jgi:hypothetical protein